MDTTKAFFSVVYAIIFMIWLEIPIVQSGGFDLVSSFITGSLTTSSLFGLGLWRNYASSGRLWPQQIVQTSAWTGPAMSRMRDPIALDEFDHGLAAVLDLDMSLKYVTASREFGTRVILRPYQKPGNTSAYIPFNFFHG